ncbi:hypothetical protein MKK75_11415 [Methylobacterium sp. J-030]|uniref:hypothetical protein n=1 Tax=Methylobacterium sp. J-030 TaxID=2836627 RepID=UPI001FB9DE41|nr:hypothetical protein [Methylobacterium sp. J-030]MCJ2069392.1 hypothetical protein [Methylobacterium sp. J-030]
MGPFTLKLSRVAAAAGPGESVQRAALSMILDNGSGDVRPVAAFEDGAMAAASAVGTAIITAFAAVGGLVTLGGPPVSPIPANGTAGPETYTRAVTLTPGTPVPPGRGVIVTSSGGGSTVGLKLQGGGTLMVGDGTGGQGTRIDGLAVVDADLSKAGANASVQVLY